MSSSKYISPVSTRPHSIYRRDQITANIPSPGTANFQWVCIGGVGGLMAFIVVRGVVAVILHGLGYDWAAEQLYLSRRVGI